LITNADDDALFNGAGTTTVVLTSGTTISVRAFQEFLLPQEVGGRLPLPRIDLSTVYEIAGAVRSSDNIANGTEKLFNYPNLRNVLGAYFTFCNNKLMDSTVPGRFRLIANGNNIIREYALYDKLFDQRNFINGDIRKGVFFELHRDIPIATELYGNMQFGITPTAAVTNPFFEIMFESMYRKGASLPGMNQGA
jgi:hypothetical protein